ncbi:TonB-dependent receptor [Fulvivirga maritima]|uniref:TonB-dependent receptor n=1 Tax=Fulvivirga maritima TaxID=2904247 RepID=UPI001F34C25A|nr:TonB-dependent receptor [Fulvivirga maritima]UII26780.1 TonB-dependent receptor [Fulvivirga maritima]
MHTHAPLVFTLTSDQVDRQFLMKNQGNTLMNTIEKLPGVSSINTGTGISKPVIRGMSFNRVIVNEYGIKQEGQQWGVDHGLELDQFGVEELEVIKGPSSVIYGSDGVGGVINIKKPTISPHDTLRGDIMVNYKSNNSLIGSSASVETVKNGLWLKGRVTWQDFADYQVPANEFLYNSYTLPIIDQKLKNTAGNELDYSVHTGIKRKWGYTTMYLSRYGQKVGFFSGAFGMPRSYQLQDDGNNRDIQLPYQNIDHWKLISNTVIFNNKSTWMIDIGYQHNLREEHSYPHSHGQGPTPQGTLALQLSLKTYSYNLRWNYDILENWHLFVGSNGQVKTNTIDGFESLIPEYEVKQTGIYVLQDLRIAKKLYWQLGARWDLARQEAQETRLPIYNDDASITDYSIRNTHISKSYSIPTLSSGVGFQASPKNSFKYNVGTAFRFPSVPELASNGVHHGTFRHEVGDSELDVEKGVLQDISWHNHQKRIDLTLAVFYYNFSNYIYLRPSSNFSTLPEAGQVYEYSQGRVNITGGELSATSLVFNNLTWMLTMEYVWNKNLDLNYPLPFTPPFHILSDWEYQFNVRSERAKPWIRLSAETFSDQNRVDQNEKRTPGHYLVHMALGVEFQLFNQLFECQLHVKNLTNKYYLNNMSRYRILNLPEQGRNIQVSIKCSL